MAKKLFKEKQQFKGLEIIALIAFLMLGVITKLISEILQPSEAYLFTLSISLGILIVSGLGLRYLLKLQLKTVVNQKHISFSMPPFQQSKEKIKWEDVTICEMIKTPLFAQWHGANINFNNEKLYSFNGRNGVHIATRNGKAYFIGSEKPDALKDAIQQAMGISL